MICKTSTFICTTTLITIYLSLLVTGTSGKPWAENVNPLDQRTPSESGKTSCPEETKSLCQRCAKQTKSPVVYPWCCTNYEAARDWCVEYLEFGLSVNPS